MSVGLVARKDFEDVVRSKLLWSILAMFLFLMLVVIGGAAAGETGEGDALDVVGLFVNVGAGLLVPIAAIFVGYLSIAGERESGSLRILFGLSHDRSDVLAGKLVSRIGTVLLVTLLACAVTAGATYAVFGSLPIDVFAGFVGLTALLAIAMTAIAVGVSASSATRYGAMGRAIGAYLLFVLIWHPALAGLHYALEGSRPGYYLPEWYVLLQYLNPMEAYRQAVMLLAGRDAHLLIGWVNVVEDLDTELAAEPGALAASERVQGELPIYLSEWAAVVVLLAWIVVPLAVGYWRFQRADLN